MSTFDASSQKVGGKLNIDTTVSLMNSLACHVETASVGSLGSNPSTTFGPYLTKTANFATDEFLDVTANFSYSISNGSASTGRVAIYLNGVIYGSDFVIESPVSSSTGIQTSKCLTKTIVGIPGGSTTVGIYYALNTGSGTIYIGNAELVIKASKYRPS